jgi:hypothetical protein
MRGDLEVPPKKAGVLIFWSVLNALIGVGSFLFGGFATNPEMQDVTMRIGYYVLNVIVVASLVGVVGPWVFTLRGQPKIAIFVEILPTLLIVLAILSFLTLDSWLQRTFSN